jgi:UDP-N-acetylglucosamine--N-acetylmuramyl-(pentapeptide) pyrophosphoryl-undecaprenol N-acetylglucosamine transferase
LALFFTSPIGLGHATRDIAIAEELNADILFVSGHAAAELLARRGYKTLDVYRPKQFDVESGELRHSFRWLMDYYSYYKKCKAVAGEIIGKNEGLVVSDEDFASIAIAEERRRRRVIITDVTETHFTTGAASVIEKRMNKTMQKMMRECDCVMIPDAGQDRDNVVHVGPIVRRARADRDSLRKSLGFTKKTIVLCVGGTDAGRYLIEKTVAAYREIQSRLDAELVIVSGPSFRLPDSPDYRNLGFVDNLHEMIFAADLVVSLAGKSTIDESVAYGTPGIFIPIKGHFEQEQGAERLGYKYDDIFQLTSLMEEKLGNRRGAVEAKGAERAAKIISSLSNEPIRHW